MTPEVITDESNTVVWEAIYKLFGEAEINSHSTVENNFRFPGQYYDQETGLHYNYNRYYDPSTGRYVTSDPIGQLGGINLFAYSRNNPINGTDPFGLIDYAVAGRATAGIIGNAAGIVGGIALSGATGGFGAVVGGVVVFKSGYGLSANAQNLYKVIRDEQPISKGALLNDVADLALPGNQNAQQLATAADLTIDLVALRLSNIAMVPSYTDRYGNVILEGGGKIGPLFYGNADKYLEVLSALQAGDAVLQAYNKKDQDCEK